METFHVGTLKGVGRACTCRPSLSQLLARARLYTTKLPATAVHVLKQRRTAFLEKHRARVHVAISDDGREFCGRPDSHPYELYPAAGGH